MSISPLNLADMPTEVAFKKQAEVACKALQNFNTVKMLNALSLIKTALTELVKATIPSHSFSMNTLTFQNQVAFNHFVFFFISHALFQDLVPTIHNTLEDFKGKHPDIKMPPFAFKITGLKARVKDSLVPIPKKGSSTYLFSFNLSLHSLLPLTLLELCECPLLIPYVFSFYLIFRLDCFLDQSYIIKFVLKRQQGATNKSRALVFTCRR